MFAWRAALFLWQKDSFSCRDAHAFNRNSSSQVKACVGTSDFPLVTDGFSSGFSLAVPSFHETARDVLFHLVTDNSAARSRAPIRAPKRQELDPRRKASLQGIDCRLHFGASGRTCLDRAAAPGKRIRSEGLEMPPSGFRTKPPVCCSAFLKRRPVRCLKAINNLK